MLLSSLWNQVYAYLRHRGAKHHDAEDLTQTVFCKLASKGFLEPEKDEFLNSTLGHAYVRTMARNQMIDCYHANNAAKRRSSSPGPDQRNVDIADSNSPDEAMMTNEALKAWESQLDRLGHEIEPGKKKALFLKVRPILLSGDRSQNLTQLSRETEIGLTTVRVQIWRWRKRLVQRFRQDFEGGDQCAA